MNPYKIGADMNSVRILWDIEPVMVWSPEIKITNSLISTVVLYMGLLQQSYIRNWSTLNYCLRKLADQLKEKGDLSYGEFLSLVYADFAEKGMEQEVECLDRHSFLHLSWDKCFRIVPKEGTCTLRVQ